MQRAVRLVSMRCKIVGGMINMPVAQLRMITPGLQEEQAELIAIFSPEENPNAADDAEGTMKDDCLSDEQLKDLVKLDAYMAENIDTKKHCILSNDAD